jgi:uncharacterized membrane protein
LACNLLDEWVSGLGIPPPIAQRHPGAESAAPFAGAPDGSKREPMDTIVKWIDVTAPPQMAYNQWTQFEEFPRFMEGVERVAQLDDARLHWMATVGGVRRAWFARITEQIPDERIAWVAEGGAFNTGVVTFHHLSPRRTRVTLQLEYEPRGFVERAGAALGVVATRIHDDLERFRDFIEARGREAGAWRETIERV